jgi:hypothetical protein
MEQVDLLPAVGQVAQPTSALATATPEIPSNEAISSMVAATIVKKRKLTATHLVASGAPAPTPIATMTREWWDEEASMSSSFGESWWCRWRRRWQRWHRLIFESLVWSFFCFKYDGFVAETM